jgi:hypothetical protein
MSGFSEGEALVFGIDRHLLVREEISGAPEQSVGSILGTAANVTEAVVIAAAAANTVLQKIQSRMLGQLGSEHVNRSNS